MRPEQKEEFKRYAGKLYLELKRKLNIQRAPKFFLVEDKDNANKILGGTGSYDKKTGTIRVYITDRLPKDILRSFAHEVIHHWQNERGQLATPGDEVKEADPQYAQNDPILRKAEAQAYLLGNVLFRDWCDTYMYGDKQSKTDILGKSKISSRG